jgi:hypothetical protein
MSAIYQGNPGVCDGCGQPVADRASYCCSDLRCVTLCEDCDAQLPESAGPRCEHEPDSPLGACAWCAEFWIERSLSFLKDRAHRSSRATTAFVA